MTFERVYTVWDYYDGPKSGIADVYGKPHYFDCEWDKRLDEYAATFRVIRVVPGQLRMALRDWKQWRAWELAYHVGKRDLPSHSQTVGKRKSIIRMEAMLRERIARGHDTVLRLRSTFRARRGQDGLSAGVMRELLVQWKSCR